jgi:hypothetical protein
MERDISIPVIETQSAVCEAKPPEKSKVIGKVELIPKVDPN